MSLEEFRYWDQFFNYDDFELQYWIEEDYAEDFEITKETAQDEDPTDSTATDDHSGLLTHATGHSVCDLCHSSVSTTGPAPGSHFELE